MANSENSKLKLLLIYDYFMKNVSAFDEEDGVTVGDIIEYLKTMTGDTFERKSIYADFDKINEFMVKTGKVPPETRFIDKASGRKWSRAEIKSEISLDEARLIVDAISTTPFVKTGLCEKIKKGYPTYFRKGYVSLHSHDEKPDSGVSRLLNTIRDCIEHKTVLSFGYGYTFAGGIKGASIKVTSPYALDWQNDKYYLIALDNDAYAASGDLEGSLRHYRVDRIEKEKRNYRCLVDREFVDLGDRRKQILDTFTRNSVNAFSTTDTRRITITISSDDVKTMLRAYAAFSDAIGNLRILRDKSSSGSVEFCFDSGITPTLFTQIFMLYTFDGLNVTIEDEEVRAKFEEYLKKALNG